jgi:glyoxylase I family protein
MLIPQPREQVWRAITDSATLAEWMFPNDFEPRMGHRFTFRVPGDPKRNFDGLTVHCEVLECQPPSRLVFSWSAGGAVVDTRVTFTLESHEQQTRLLFEHSGFDLSHPLGNQAFKGAEFGWAKMLKDLSNVVARQQPVVLGLWGVRYQVRDVERSIAFYTRTLGFHLDRQHLPAFGQVSTGNLKLILSGPGASGSRPLPDGRQQEPGGWNRVVLQVGNLPARINELKSQGVRFRNEMETGPGGRQVQIEDPDGNPIELFEPDGR